VLSHRVSGKFLLGAAVLAALLLLMQLRTVDRTNPPVQADLVAPPAVEILLRRACYDCHSHETRWPWYSRLAPVSWWLADHVRQGRADLNFSQWPLFDAEAQGLLLQDIEKQLEEGTMPLRSYALGHPEARLTDAEKTLLVEWARSGY
jgi:hypothetical protein